MHMARESDLVRGTQLDKLLLAIETKIAHERNRIKLYRESKQEVTVYKTEQEVLQVEQCYAEALAEVAPGMDLKGLSPLEYATMCLYYDS